jgi:hypothetical protein
MPQRKTLISIAILLIIGLHAVPILYRARKKTLWPILEWTMYNDSRPPGPIQATKKRVTGITVKGEREAVTPDLVGLSVTTLGQLYFRPMWAGDSSAARRLIDRLNRWRTEPFVELRLEGETYTVTDAGVLQEESPVVTYHLDPSPAR